MRRRAFRDQDPANVKAAELAGNLHDALAEAGYTGDDLERFLVRVVFCLFADDTGIFEPRDIFLNYIEERTSEDGSDTGARLAELFQVLDTPEDARQRTLDEDLARFPYVNGDLFRDALRIPSFNAAMRNAPARNLPLRLVEHLARHLRRALSIGHEPGGTPHAGRALHDREEHPEGHRAALSWTILRAEFERLKARRDSRRSAELRRFQEKLGRMNFFDPACGCGNFLIIAYRELRELEMEVIRELRADEIQRELDVAGFIANHRGSVLRDRTRRVSGAHRRDGALDDGPHHEQPAEPRIRPDLHPHSAHDLPPRPLRRRPGNRLGGASAASGSAPMFSAIRLSWGHQVAARSAQQTGMARHIGVPRQGQFNRLDYVTCVVQQGGCATRRKRNAIADRLSLRRIP